MLTFRRKKLGRVSRIYTLGSFVLLPFTFAFTGWLIDHVDVGGIFITARNLAALVISILPSEYRIKQSSISLLIPCKSRVHLDIIQSE